LVLELALVLEREAQLFEHRIGPEGLNEVIVDPQEKNIQGFGGLADFGAELLEGGFPGASAGIAGVNAEDGGDKGAQVAQPFSRIGALLVSGSNLGQQALEPIPGQGLGDLEGRGKGGTEIGQGDEVSFEAINGGGDLGIVTAGVEVAVVPGLMQIRHRSDRAKGGLRGVTLEGDSLYEPL
jgi:hypothetical protein